MRSHTKIFSFIILDMAQSKRHKFWSLNSLHLVLSNVNTFFKEINRNDDLTLLATIESKEQIKKYEQLWIKFRELIMPITKNWYDHNKKYTKI